MGAVVEPFNCIPVSCGFRKIEDTIPIGSSEDLFPSALVGGKAWEQASYIAEKALPDINVALTLFNTDLDVSCANRSTAPIETRIILAKQLLDDVREILCNDHLANECTSDYINYLRPSSMRELTKRALESRSMKSGYKKNMVQKYDLKLPPWCNTWRLKCAVAQLFGIPCKDQFLLCSKMTAQSSLKWNHPASLLAELPVYPSQQEKPKRKDVHTKINFSAINGTKKRGKRASNAAKSSYLNLVICISRSARYQLIGKNGASLDVKPEPMEIWEPEEVTRTTTSECRTPKSNGDMKLSTDLFDSIVKLDDTENHDPEKSYNSEIMDSNDQEKCCSTLTKVCSNAAGCESFARQVNEVTYNNNKLTNEAYWIFLQMSIESDKADFLKVMLGLTRLEGKRPKVAQGKMFFASMGCSITDCITVNHLRFFLQSPRKDEDQWLTSLRNLMLKRVCQI